MKPPTSFWQSPGGASAISAGAQLLGGAFGSGDGYNTYRSHARKLTQALNHLNWRQQVRAYKWLSPREDARSLRMLRKSTLAQVQGAREAGLHPLFALGGGSASVSPTVTAGAPQGGSLPPGQPRTGSFAQDALAAVSAHYARVAGYRAQADLLEQQNKASQLKLAAHQVSNDVATGIDAEVNRALAMSAGAPAKRGVIPQHHPATQEVKKGEVDTHRSGSPEQSMREKSPMTLVKVGSQEVWVPVEDLESFFEDPTIITLGTVYYHGNKNVDWAQLINEWMGRKPTPSQVTKGTRQMFKRNKIKTKSRRDFRDDQFYSHSRGPHR